MAVSQELVAKFKADTSDFNKKVKGVKREIETVGVSSKKMSKEVTASADTASRAFKGMGVSVTRVTAVLGTATVAVGAFSIKVGSDMESATRRIEAMLGSVQKADFVLNNLRQAGYDTGASVVALTQSYGKLATFVENGSISLQESVDIQKGLTNTATALGASNEQLSTVMYGLSQAMGSGIVRAEEFNQVTEPLPGIINRMEEATGLASGELRKMINDGLITSEMFKDILIPALGSFETQAVEMQETLKVQSGIMSNTAVALGEDLYDGIAPALTGLIGLLNDFSQRFVSVKRASKDELSRRLAETNELYKQASETNFGRYNANKPKRLMDLNAQQQELMAARFPLPVIDDVDGGTEKPITADPKTVALLARLRGQKGKGSAKGKTKISEAQKEENEQIRIRERAIASAKRVISTSEAEASTMRMLSHEKKIAIELNKLQSVGISENSKQYENLSIALQKALLVEAQMKETVDLENYVRNKNNENEALADQAKFIGMTSSEIEQYNIHKELQIDLEKKSIELTKAGFEEYKKTATALAEQKALIAESNKEKEDSFSGGIKSLMARAREDILTEADIIQQGYDIMSSNITDSLVGLADGTKNSFKEMASSIVNDIQRVIVKALIMRAVTGIVGSFAGGATSTGGGSIGANGASGFQLSGARANGGYVGANKSYLVGERGAEILTMGSQGGYITSNDKSMGPGGSTTINIDARGASNGVEQEIRKVMNDVINLKKQVPNIAISAVREQNSRSGNFLR